MAALWATEKDELPPEATSESKKPEVFAGLPAGRADGQGAGGAAELFGQFAESQALAPGAVVRVKKTGQAEVVLECFSTYVKCHSGEAYSRHAVDLLCGALPLGFDRAQFKKDVEVARGILEGLRTRGAVVIENILSEPDRVAAARAAEELSTDEDLMFTAGTGAGHAHKRDGSMRGDQITWLPKNGTLPPPLQRVQDKMNRIRRSLAYVSGKALPKSTTQLSRYPGGGVGYVKHRDVKLNAEAVGRRRVTCLYYFNEGWEEAHGGCLEIYPESGKSQLVELKAESKEEQARKAEAKLRHPVVVQPRSGTMVLFPAHRLHRVLPDHAPRVAMGTWFLGPESLGLSHPDSEHDLDTHFIGNEEIFPSR